MSNFLDPFKVVKCFEKLRKKYIQVKWEHSVKEDGCVFYEGFLCLNEKTGMWLLNINLDSVSHPEFKTLPITRIISITHKGKTLSATSAGQKIEESQKIEKPISKIVFSSEDDIILIERGG